MTRGNSSRWLRVNEDGVTERYCKPGKHWLAWNAINFYESGETHENLSLICREHKKKQNNHWRDKRRDRSRSQAAIQRRKLKMAEKFTDLDTAQRSYEETGQRFNEFIDQVWGMVWHGKLGTWDYPAMVIRHLKEHLTELETRNAELEAQVKIYNQMQE